MPTGLGMRLASAALDPPVEANFRPLTPNTAGTYVIEDLPSMTRQWLRVRGVPKELCPAPIHLAGCSGNTIECDDRFAWIKARRTTAQPRWGC